MTYQAIQPKEINDHAVDKAIVEFFGLGSVLDIATVTKVGRRYEIVLEDGTKKFSTVDAINDVINAVKPSYPQTGTIYTITNRFNKYSGVVEFLMVDPTNHQVKHIERRVSSIYNKGMKVTINNKREINAV